MGYLFTGKQKLMVLASLSLALVSIVLLYKEIITLHKLNTYIAEESFVASSVTFENDISISNNESTSVSVNQSQTSYLVINKSSRKIHTPDCEFAQKISDDNKITVNSSELEQYLSSGYVCCSGCMSE